MSQTQHKKFINLPQNNESFESLKNKKKLQFEEK